MTNLLGPDTFEFFARYLLAGIVIISVRSRFVKGDRPKTSERLFEAVILSLINQAVFYVFEWLGTLTLPALTLEARFSLILEVLVLPAALGLLAGWNLSRGWNEALFRRLSMPIEHPVERAYDFAFEQHANGAFVILSFRDGTRIHGLFGSNSLAANDPERSEIYLEQLYDIAEDGSWQEPELGKAALISLSDIRSIEFIDLERKMR